MKNRDFLPYCLPSIGRSEVKEVVNTITSGWMTMGPKTRKFEEEFAKYIGVKYAVAVNSCTAGLHLALLAHGVGNGDEVIIPSFTFAATANVVVNVGAVPVFADIDGRSFNLDPKEVKNKITKKTKAIIVVHYAGQAAELTQLETIAKKNKLVLIEDAAHAVGSKYQGERIGKRGNTTCYSFYATKNMTTGEGGMVTTNNEQIADVLSKLRLHGISKDAWKRYDKGGSWKYDLEFAGWKYNMTDLQASLGLHQLKKLEGFLRRRNKLANVYKQELSGVEQVDLPVELKGRFHAFHLYPILVPKKNRDDLIEFLKDEQIGTSVHFIPVHKFDFYKKRYGILASDLPVTEQVFLGEISLPLYPAMKIGDVKYVCKTIKKYFDRNEKV